MYIENWWIWMLVISLWLMCADGSDGEKSGEYDDDHGY